MKSVIFFISEFLEDPLGMFVTQFHLALLKNQTLKLKQTSSTNIPSSVGIINI